MSITVSNTRLTDNVSPSSPTSLAYSSNNTVNNGLIIAVTIDAGATVNTPTDTATNSYTTVKKSSGGSWQADVYMVKQCKGGANTVSVTFSGATFISLSISEISDSGGNANGFNFDQTATANGTTANPSLTTAATTVANELVYGIEVDDAASLATGGAGYSTFNPGVNTSHIEEDKFVTSTGTQVVNFGQTLTITSWTITAATFFTVTDVLAASPGQRFMRRKSVGWTSPLIDPRTRIFRPRPKFYLPRKTILKVA